MKALVTLVCFLFSASAFAALDFSQGQVIDKFQIDGKDSKFTGTVTIQRDQLQDNIRVHVLAPPDCPANRFCPEVMQEIDLNAELITTYTDYCGSIVYQGMTDKSPADGARTEITVQDHSDRHCRDMRKGIIEIEATESFFQIKSVKKYFAVQSWKYDNGNFDLSKGVQMKSVKLTGGEVAGSNGYVLVNEKVRRVLVSYDYGICGHNDEACQAILLNKTMNLVLDSKKNDGCGSIVYKAHTANIIPGGEYQTVTITDNTHRLCDDVVRARIVVDGKITHPYPQSKPVTIEMLK